MLIPGSPDELTSAWLSSALVALGLGPAGVRSFETELLGGEQGMTGQLVRLRPRYRDDRPGLPVTLMAKFSAAEPATRAMISALGHYQREVRFYERLSERTPVTKRMSRVPWNFGGGPVSIRLRSRGDHCSRR